MVIMSTKQHPTFPCQNCVHVSLINMRLLIANVCFGVVTNVQVLSYPVNNQTRMKQACVPQYFFMYTYFYRNLLCMAGFRKK